MNENLVQARQLLALLYINNKEWEKARKEIEKILKIDTNNTTALRYLKEVEENTPKDDDKKKKKKEAVVYKSGNDTVIQPVAKKDNSFWHVILNVVIGVAIGVAIAWYLVVPAGVNIAQSDSNAQIKAISEQLDAKTVAVDELTQQLESLTAENDTLTTSLSSADSKEVAISAYTDLIEATLMYVNKTGGSTDIAETLKLISEDYLENYASESFRNLYNQIYDSVSGSVATDYYNAGYEAYKSEDYTTAIENFEKAFEYDSTNGEALYFLANSYYRSGNTSMAVETYQMVIDNFPDTEKAKKAENYIKEIQG